MRLTPADVMEQTFRTTFRGVDPVEVDAFLQRIADELEHLREERDRLALELEEEKKARRTLEEALAAARTLQEGILTKARQEAELVEAQARQRADRILAEANEELLRVRREIETLRQRWTLWLAEAEGLAHTLLAWVKERKDRPPQAPELITNCEEGSEDDPGADA